MPNLGYCSALKKIEKLERELQEYKEERESKRRRTGQVVDTECLDEGASDDANNANINAANKEDQKMPAQSLEANDKENAEMDLSTGMNNNANSDSVKGEVMKSAAMSDEDVPLSSLGSSKRQSRGSVNCNEDQSNGSEKAEFQGDEEEEVSADEGMDTDDFIEDDGEDEDDGSSDDEKPLSVLKSPKAAPKKKESSLETTTAAVAATSNNESDRFNDNDEDAIGVQLAVARSLGLAVGGNGTSGDPLVLEDDAECDFQLERQYAIALSLQR
jgi:hypothetical protein